MSTLFKLGPLIFSTALFACASQPIKRQNGAWKRIDNRKFIPESWRSFTNGNSDFLEISSAQRLTRKQFEIMVQDRVEELRLLAQRLTEPYFGSSRDQAGCLNEGEVDLPAKESPEEIRKEVSSRADENFVLVGCADGSAFYRTRLVYLYCKSDASFVEAKLYWTRTEPGRTPLCGERF